MKVQVSLDDKLMERIDNYADGNYMSRSGFITLACTQYLNSVEVMMLVKDMSLAMRKIADNNIVDDDTMKKFEDFERLSKLITSQM